MNNIERIGAAAIFAAASFGSPASVDAAKTQTIKINKGETREVPANCVAAADIKVNGTPLFDHNALTGLVVEIYRPASVTAEFGNVDVDCYSSDVEVRQAADALEARAKERGCTANAGCAHVQREVHATSEVAKRDDSGGCTADRELQPGESDFFPAGTVGKGDIRFNGEKRHDDKGGTGLVFVLKEGGHVYAEWGANLQIIKECMEGNETYRTRITDRFVQESYATGCEDNKGCRWVDVITLPGNRQAVNLDQRIAEVNAGWTKGLAA